MPAAGRSGSGDDGPQRAAPFPEKGGNVTFKVKSAGMSTPLAETVLDYQPGKLQLLQMEGMLSGRAGGEPTPEGDGTRLTTTFDYTLPGGVFGKIADALMVKRMNGKSLEAALHNFTALVNGRRLFRTGAGASNLRLPRVRESGTTVCETSSSLSTGILGAPAQDALRAGSAFASHTPCAIDAQIVRLDIRRQRHNSLTPERLLGPGAASWLPAPGH